MQEPASDYWVLNWPKQIGFKTKYTEKLIINTPTSKKTFYGRSIENTEVEQVLQKGITNINQNPSQKWKNTLEFYKFALRREEQEQKAFVP
ncbi:MAG: hypothetical protein WBZ20_00595 [Nitrososphaeraceae archaeon]